MFGTVLGSIAVLRFAMSMVSAFNMVGQALLTLGRLAMANPLLAAIGVLAIIAITVWQNWDTLGPKFIALWEIIKGAFGAAVDWIAAKWNTTVEWVMGAVGGISDWFGGLGAGLMEIGSGMITALIDGITNRLGALKDAIGNLGTSALGWLREKLGLQASDAAGDGASSGAARAARTVGTIATAASLVGTPAFAANSPTATGPLARLNTSLDYHQPLRAPAAASAAPASGPVTINITTPPGANEQDFVRAMRAEMDRREREKAMRTGSRLSD